MGHAPDWMRQSYGKVKKMADGGSADLPDMGEPMQDRPRLQGGAGAYKTLDDRDAIGGGASYELGNGDKLTAGGGVSYATGPDKSKMSDVSGGYRVGYAKNLGEGKELDVGTTGYRYRSRRGDQVFSGGEDANSIDVRYRDKEDEYGIGYEPGTKRVLLSVRKRF